MAEPEQPLLNGAEKGADEQRCIELGEWEKSQSLVKSRKPIDGGSRKDVYCDNEVTTSKYTFFPLPYIWNWIVPKNLFEQFHRYANIYFLVVSVFQIIPTVSPTGKFTTLIPLTMVLFVTMLKDGYEDWQRHKRDKELNNLLVKVWRGAQWQEVRWTDVVVGDYCRVVRDENPDFPADLLLLWSDDPQYLCQIETANLDGETNLKLRKAHLEPVKPGVEPVGTPQPFDPGDPLKDPWDQRLAKLDPSQFQGKVMCELPNKRLYNFEGKLIRPSGGAKPTTSAVGVDSILLRGSKLGGCTKMIIGLVVFTGAQTKLMMNQQKARHKSSQLENATNKQIKLIVVMQAVLCTTCAILLGITVGGWNGWYLEYDMSAVLSAVRGAATFLILFNNLIPISLYVSMEMVKIMQAKLVNSDMDMYHGESDTPAEAKTSSLNEELGQVQYIFSDKTGTLTCNIMDFLKFSVGGSSYGTGTTEIGRAAAAREGRVLKDDRPPGIKTPKGFFFYDERISDVEGSGVNWNWCKQPNKADLLEFFTHLAICHTVVVEEVTEEGKKVKKYQASSPDEQCLVYGAKFLGVEFIDRDTEDVTINIMDSGGKREEKWGLHEVLEFNSDRKRMSIIVKSPQGKLMLLCKGADTVIYERLDKGKNAAMLEKTKDFLKQFAQDGLRTLCIAQVEVDPKFYGDGVENDSSWQWRYKQAKEAIGGREEKVSKCAEEIEKNLQLIGTTAIEDKLQVGVPATIELLRCAGVNVWVLTGDKQETAINIGFACSLLHNNMGVFLFKEGMSVPDLSKTLREYAQDAGEVSQKDPDRDLGVVVQGSTLTHITAVEKECDENRAEFLKLTCNCKAVICCRVTPGQKAEVVRLVKEGLGMVTLSIGDGANDVAMITEAHVGIGISGLEGLQAARSADYSIGQFRFLTQLMLVHGRWNYRRMCKVILYSFYKNILLYLTQFWFCIFNAFSGQSLYDRWAIAGYNVGFTALPIMAVGLFDRDVEKKRLTSMDQFPELYDSGRLSQFFGTGVFWGWTGTAIWQSIVCFFIPMLTLASSEMCDPSTGRPIEMHWAGITAYTAVVWVVTIKCVLETNTWTKWNHIMTWGSAAMWYIFLIIYGELWSFILEMGENWHQMYRFILPQFWSHWAVVLLAVAVGVIRDVAWKFWKRTFRASLLHKVQRWEAYVREGRHGLTDFNYTMMRRVHPELIPRPRVSEGGGKGGEGGGAQIGPPPLAGDGGEAGDRSAAADDDITEDSADRSGGMQGDNSARDTSWPQYEPPASIPPHSDPSAHASPWPPQQQLLYPPNAGAQDPQGDARGRRVRREAPPGHVAGTQPVSRYSGAIGPSHTGYGFSQSEGNQVEIIAARSGADSRWAQGFGRLPSPRAQVHPPGRMPISGMVENADGGMSMHGRAGRPPPRNPVGPPQPRPAHQPAPYGGGSAGAPPLSPGSYNLPAQHHAPGYSAYPHAAGPPPGRMPQGHYQQQ